NTLFEGIRKGDKVATEQYIKEVLDPLDEKFMNIIRENLPGIQEEHLTGTVFFARDLMGSVVNSIGTLDDAINRADELAKEKNQSTGNQSTAIETKTPTGANDTQISKIINMKQY